MTYYRLAQIPNTLPKHWAYGDAWIFDNDKLKWIDNRSPGFQVFSSLGDALKAALGEDMDGFYEAADYPQLLEITVDQDYVVDGCSLYFAITNSQGVLNTRAIATKSFIETAEKLFEIEKNKYGYIDDDLPEWIEESEDGLATLFDNVAKQVQVEYIETLPHPHSYLKT